MSISYTSISNSELTRLRTSAERGAKAVDELDALKRKRAAREVEIRAESRAEIDRLNRTISSLKKENDDTKAEVKKLNADFVKRLDAERDRANHRIDTLSERVDRINADLGARIDKIDARTKDARERAKIFAEELFAMIKTAEELRPEKFGYGKTVENLKLLANSVKDDMERGNFEAALAISQREVISAMDVVAALALLNNDFNEGLTRAKMKEAELLETFKEYSAENKITYTDPYGKKKSADFDIDHWSDGGLSRAEKMLSDIREEFEKADENSFGMGALQALEDKLEELEEALVDTERRAEDAFFTSCNLESVAIKLHRIMSDEGYIAEQSGFFENDDRESFNMTYVDDSGNTVAFVIAPDEGDGAKIAMETYGADPDDDEIKEGTRVAVSSALEEQELEVGETRISDKCNSKEKCDEFIEKVSKSVRKQKK